MKRYQREIMINSFWTLIVALGMIFTLSVRGQAEDTRSVTVKNFQMSVIYDDDSQATPMPDSEYTITYADADGNSVKVADGTTDTTGAIKNLTIDIPNDVSSIRFNYTLGTTDRGNGL